MTGLRAGAAAGRNSRPQEDRHYHRVANTPASAVGREAAQPGDGLLFTSARRRVWTLAFPSQFRDFRDLALARKVAFSDSLYGEEISAERIRARKLAADRIVVLGDPEGDPVDATEQEVIKHDSPELLRGMQQQGVHGTDHGVRPPRAPFRTVIGRSQPR